jgi:hypothetical protein
MSCWFIAGPYIVITHEGQDRCQSNRLRGRLIFQRVVRQHLQPLVDAVEWFITRPSVTRKFFVSAKWPVAHGRNGKGWGLPSRSTSAANESPFGAEP